MAKTVNETEYHVHAKKFQGLERNLPILGTRKPLRR
jgi:hypothetical protein